MALPKGGQKNIHGPVVCVPTDLKKNDYVTFETRRKSFAASEIEEKAELQRLL